MTVSLSPESELTPSNVSISPPAGQFDVLDHMALRNALPSALVALAKGRKSRETTDSPPDRASIRNMSRVKHPHRTNAVLCGE